MAFVAVENKSDQLVGAVWARLHILKKAGYGFVSEDIPELDLTVKLAFQGMGLGTRLLHELIE